MLPIALTRGRVSGRLVPDHKTIADFRKVIGEAICKVYAQFIMDLFLHAAPPTTIAAPNVTSWLKASERERGKRYRGAGEEGA